MTKGPKLLDLDDDLVQVLSGAFGVVRDSTMFVHSVLWEKYALGAAGISKIIHGAVRTDYRIDWSETHKEYHITIGHFGRHPIAINVSIDMIGNRKIVWIEDISRVVDHDAIDAWIEKFVHQQSPGGHAYKVDAANFGDLLGEIDRVNKVQTD